MVEIDEETSREEGRENDEDELDDGVGSRVGWTIWMERPEVDGHDWRWRWELGLRVECIAMVEVKSRLWGVTTLAGCYIGRGAE